MAPRPYCLIRGAALCLLVATAASTTGCIGFANWVLWGLRGHKIAAECDALEGKRVAVICATRSSPFEPAGTTGSISRQVGMILAREVKNIDVVDVEEVADWIDRNDWTQMDYREVGKGVKADMVVAVDFDSLSFQDSVSNVRGRADFKVSVFDMSTNKRIFLKETREHTFPSHGPAGVSLRKFEPIYIERLAKHISYYFYDHDFTEDFGTDAMVH